MLSKFHEPHIPSPCFVIEQASILRNLETLQKLKDKTGIKILLAQKAFSNWFLYPLIAQYLDGAAASSLNEARLAKEEMGLEVHTYSPAFKEDQIEDILEYSNHVVFNSLTQLERFRNTVASHLGTHHFFLRVNPGYSAVENDLYNPVLPGTRFGVSRGDLNQIPKGITGFHFHALCENNSYDLEKTLHSFEKLFGDLLSDITYLNIGGGHFITHPDYNIRHLIQLLNDFSNRYPHLELIMEPGSAIALNSGFLKTSVQDIVSSEGINTAVIDASITAHMPDCLEMPYQPQIHEGEISKDGPFLYQIGGNSCLSGDYLPPYSFQKPLKVGDTIHFLDQIHYTLVKTSFFNGVDHPSIGVLKKDGSFELVKEFKYKEFKNKLG